MTHTYTMFKLLQKHRQLAPYLCAHRRTQGAAIHLLTL